MDYKNQRENTVLRFNEVETQPLINLLRRFALDIHISPDDSEIPGSFWGDCEAGLIRNHLYIRSDTPLHSILHESCHFICMDGSRRIALDSNAGGDTAEENAVCYLQILLARDLPQMGKNRMLEDMDAWGYSFRLGSARDWFDTDAEDARDWLLSEQLITLDDKPCYKLR